MSSPCHFERSITRRCLLLLGFAILLHAIGNWKDAVAQSRASRPLASSGTVRALFVYVKFSDDTFENHCTTEWNAVSFDSTRPSWTNMIVDSVKLPQQTPGSLSDYFATVSYGNFSLVGDIFPRDNLVYVPPHPESYYVRRIEEFPPGDPRRRGLGFLNAEILKDLDETIDYRRYDTNPKDGVVDMIFMLYRKYSIVTAGDCVGSYTGIARLDPCLDGFFPIRLDSVEITGGDFGSGLTMRHAIQLYELREVGAHELGHFWFGSTHYGDKLGEFGYPAAPGRSAFEKIALGWASMTPPITADTTDLVIDDLASNPEAIYGIPLNSRASHYLLLENRQRTNLYEQQFRNACGALKGLPAPGLLVTEVRTLPLQEASTTRGRILPIRVVAADGTWQSPGAAGDTFKPGDELRYPLPRARQDGGDAGDELVITNIRQASSQVIVDIFFKRE